MLLRAAVTAFALASAFGCRAAPLETLTRPRGVPPPAEAPAVPPAVHLIAQPIGLHRLFAPLAAGITDADLRSVLPRPPVPVVPGRPLAGGEPLRLANLALSRGDPLDAAAQYRALLVDAPASYATYVRWRLALAYLALDRRADAEPLLREVAGAWRPESWAALITLAELVAERDGAVAALRDLQGLAGEHADELEAKLIDVGEGADRVALLLARAERVRTEDEGCACALAAIALDPDAQLDDVGRICRRWLISGRLGEVAPEVAKVFAPLMRFDPQLALIDAANREWEALDDDPRIERIPESWLKVARAYYAAYVSDRGTNHGELASWAAVAALDNAARLAVADRAIDAELLAQSRLLASEANPRHRAYALAIHDKLRQEVRSRLRTDDATPDGDGR